MSIQWFYSLYVVLFVVCAIDPYSRAVWFAENLPIVLIVCGIALINRTHQFSRASILAMSVLVFLHTIGGHFTFERVPFDWVTDTFGFQRNHYDRIAHFSVGFYAYAICELVLAKRWVANKTMAAMFSLFAIISIAGLYEVVEWLYAISADPDAGIAVLGSQGDAWDAQKDILADTLGACVAILIFMLQRQQSRN